MNAEPSILDTLRAAIAKMPPPEMWVSYSMLPPDRAIVAEGKKEKFVAAHPDFWRRVKYELAAGQSDLQAANLLGTPRRLFGLEIVEIDRRASDSEEAAEWRHGLRVRFGKALCENMGVDHDPFGVDAMAAFGMGPLGRKAKP